MESGAIPDDSITASSWYTLGVGYEPYRGRLNGVAGAGVWSVRTRTIGEWLQVDLGEMKTVTGTIIQGRSNQPQWVTSYKLQYSVDGRSWITYASSDGSEKVFQGNTDRNTPVTNLLDSPTDARYVRFLPQSWYRWMSMRVEVLGCSVNDIDECAKNPCQHGRCKNKNGGYKCTCSPGWTGQNCQQDIDECIRYPCQHGRCVNKNGGYKCTCSPGWTGQNCQQGSTNRGYTYKSVGCFADKSDPAILWLERTDPRLGESNYRYRTDAIEKCFQVALSRGFNVFALQNGGACTGSASGPTVYTTNRPSRYPYRCEADGKGGYYAKEVYQITATARPSLGRPWCQSGWNSHDNYCYKLVNVIADYESAKRYCSSQSANLVSIGSPEENTFVTNLITNVRNPVWIGLKRRYNRWTWSDGSRLVYKNWQTRGQWNNGAKNCAAIEVGVPIVY
ncbi:uncharacterized protein LOC144925334 [Branchiostoma floridae x Branchiostoma belcheri]